MANATFHNFTDRPFTGHWNGKAKTFAPGAKQLMPAFLAEHFAKYLTNDVLIREGKEIYTSPKKPLDVPQFMDLFNKAFIPEKQIAGGNEIDDLIGSAAADSVTADEVSSDIKPVKLNHVDESSPAAAAAAMRGEDPNADKAEEEDPYTPSGNEVGPGAGSMVIGEAGDEDYEGDEAEEAAAA